MTVATVECLLCPHHCRLAEYERGQCRVRINVDGALHSLVYGRPCATHVDPIEKKPMYHVLPGSRAFSIATAGCCLHCKYCQNWTISQANPEDVRTKDMPPAAVVAAARDHGCHSIAYTYTEPTVFFEYVYDTCVLAHEAGLLNVNVTSGYIERAPCRELSQVMDCANVDLKGFSDEFYRDVCGGSLAPVLAALEVMREEGTFIEVTNLLVPGLNDDMALFRQMCQWLVRNLGADTPLHISRFHPQFRLRNTRATPPATLQQAYDIARTAGLLYVYVGNIALVGASATRCPSCQATVIDRMGFFVTANEVTGGRCRHCGAAIAGIWQGREDEK